MDQRVTSRDRAQQEDWIMEQAADLDASCIDSITRYGGDERAYAHALVVGWETAAQAGGRLPGWYTPLRDRPLMIDQIAERYE